MFPLSSFQINQAALCSVVNNESKLSINCAMCALGADYIQCIYVLVQGKFGESIDIVVIIYKNRKMR